MEAYIERMCKEHKELSEKLTKLANYINTKGIVQDSKIEFANKYLQFAAMKIYEEALRNRLAGVGIVYANGQYYEEPAKIANNDDSENSDNKNKTQDSDN